MTEKKFLKQRLFFHSIPFQTLTLLSEEYPLDSSTLVPLSGLSPFFKMNMCLKQVIVQKKLQVMSYSKCNGIYITANETF